MRVIKLLLLSLIFFTSLGFASNFDTALELARAKMADKVIDRLNSIYEYANKYILQTRDTNITNQKLKQKYNLPSTAFKNNRGGDFNTTYEKNENISKIVFHNALPNASTLMRKIVKQSTVLSSKAKFDDSNLSDIKFVYILPLETQNFINNKDKKVLSTTNQSIIDDTIIVNSKDELSRLQKQPQTGTIAYVKKDNVLQTYIKTENGWAKETTTSTNKLNTASECNLKTIGALNYSKEKGCMLFCSLNNGNPQWKCTQSTNHNPVANDDISSKGKELISENFDNNLYGWINGSLDHKKLKVKGDDTRNHTTTITSKEFDFGKQNAGKTVHIQFDLFGYQDDFDNPNDGGWEKSGPYKDFFNIYINNKLISSDSFGNGSDITHEYSFDAKLDDNGKINLGLAFETSSVTREFADIDNLKITAGDDWGSKFVTDKNTPIIILTKDILSNDKDEDNDTISISQVNTTSNTHGSVTLQNNKITYAPQKDYYGKASFTYTITDGKGGSDKGIVNVTVNKGNTPPIIKDDVATNITGATDLSKIDLGKILKTGPKRKTRVTAIYKAGSDKNLLDNTNNKLYTSSDYNSNVSYKHSAPSGYSNMGGHNWFKNNNIFKTWTEQNQFYKGIVIFEDGTVGFIDYISNGDGYNESAYIYYKIYENLNKFSTNLTVDENKKLTISTDTLLINDSDEDGDTLSVIKVSSTPNTHGTVSLNGNTIIYTPQKNYSGQATFNYTISDGKDTATAKVTLLVKKAEKDNISTLKPIAWYKFDEKSQYNGTYGEVKDSSGNNRNGEVHNFNGWGTWAYNIANGKHNRAVKFDYLGEVETHNIPDIVTNHDFSYSLWLNYSSIDGWAHVIGRREAGKNDFQFLMLQNKSRFWVFRVGTTNGWEEMIYDTRDNYKNKWTLVTFVKKGQTMKLYINGTLKKTQTLNHTSKAWCGSSYPLRLGSRKGGYSGDGIRGYIDDVMIFDRALSDSEVKKLYN